MCSERGGTNQDPLETWKLGNYETMKRNISYIMVDKNNYKNQFTPSDSQIENYYNNIIYRI